jgi:hypothetical protein
MADDPKVNAFIYYVLEGFYAKARKAHGQLLVLKKSDLYTILGCKRLGSAQRAQLQEACIYENIAVAELSDRLVFFSLDDVARDRTFDMTPHVTRLRDETNEFALLRSREADEEWEKRYGSGE